jgi:hypothetical protein
MPDKNNWIEGTKFKIKIEHTAGKLESPTGKIQFTMEAGYKTALAEADVTIPRMGDIEHEVTLPDVKDDAASYRFSYKIKVDSKDIYESDWFFVWPKSIHLTAKYKKETGDVSKFKEGDNVPDFPFSVGEIDENGKPAEGGTFKTDGLGIREFTVASRGAVTIKPKSPWEIMDPTSQADCKRMRTFKVRMKPWKAQIKSHNAGKTATAAIKQIVNAAQDYATGKGSLIKVEVGPPDLADAVRDQEIKVRVTFPATNAKRTDPCPALWLGEDKSTAQTPNPSTAKPGVAELKYEAVVKIPANGQAAVFYVQVGVCGGDTCKIEVGVTDTYEDDVLHVVNWRKIGLELFVAAAALRQKCTKVLADSGAALGDELKTELDRIFEKTFIEFFYPTNACIELKAADMKKYLKGTGSAFTEDDIDKPEALFVDRTKFKVRTVNSTRTAYEYSDLPAGGDKVFLCSDYQRRLLRDEKLKTVKKTKDTMTWIFVDFISARSDVNLVAGTPSFKADMSKVTNWYVTTFEGVDEKAIELPFCVFELDPVEASGKLGAIKVNWRATHYKKVGQTPPVWSDITGSSDPGGAYKDFTEVVFTSAAIRDKWLEHVNSYNVKLKLKKDAADDPGKLLKIKKTQPKTGGGTEEVEYDLKIQVQYDFYGVSFGTLGGAVCGEGQVRTGGGRVTVLGMAQTLAHEILHNCGQTYMGTVTGEVGGWSARTAIPGIPFAAAFPDSPYYVGKGHQGSHCAKALHKLIEGETALIKAAVAAGKFTAPTPEHQTAYFSKVKQTDQCIMYGDGPEMATESMDLCDTCKSYLRATDLSDVCGNW